MKTIAQSLGLFGIPLLEVPGCKIEGFAEGRALEERIATGQIHAVLDLYLGELADELFGGTRRAGLDRLTAAAIAGIPQVLAPGGLDFVLTSDGPRQTTPEECDRLGLEVAQKACAAKGPTVILLPRYEVDSPMTAFVQSLQNWSYGIEIVEVNCGLLDSDFAKEVIRRIPNGFGGI